MMIVAVKRIKREFGTEFSVDLFQSGKIKVVKHTFRTVLCQICKNKTVVINIKIASINEIILFLFSFSIIIRVSSVFYFLILKR